MSFTQASEVLFVLTALPSSPLRPSMSAGNRGPSNPSRRKRLRDDDDDDALSSSPGMFPTNFEDQQLTIVSPPIVAASTTHQ